MNNDTLIDLLEQLRRRLNSSGVERTSGLGKALGRDCPNYKKSMRIFVEKDKADITRLIKEIKL